MIVSKRDTSNIYKGCLSYLRESLSAVLPKNQTLLNEGIKGIVGSETVYNVHNSPWNAPPAYFEIYFGKKYIYPIAYSLMGRRVVAANFLKSWDFYGKNARGYWVLISNYTDEVFTQGQIKTYYLNTKESFSAFKIQMTEPDSKGEWALCLGQIEVFGDIYSRPFSKWNECTKQRTKHFNVFTFVFISLLLS